VDSMDAAKKLVDEFGVNFCDARKAVEQEAEAIQTVAKENRRRLKYGEAVEIACDRVTAWIKGCDTYTGVKLEWGSVAYFLATHRPACAWAVLTGKAIQAKAEVKG
jgi:hypothetical protein